MVRYAILGPVELCDGERRMAAAGRRQAALLALLLVNANRAVSGDRLIDVVWGDLGPAGALKRLQVAITRLRRVLDHGGRGGGSVLRTVAGGYLLDVQPGELDAELFATRVDDGRRLLEIGDAARARDVLREALGIWRGCALASVAAEPFAQPEIRRLEELRVAALEMRTECEMQLGEHSELIGELEALAGAHPGRARLAGQLMLALYRCGRQGDALDVYARTRTYLSGELGLEPGPVLKTLQHDILRQSPALAAPGGASAAAPQRVLPRALQPAPGELPFTGRAAELACLTERWADIEDAAHRVVLISGEAGIGKTRAAAELAARVHDEGSSVLYGRCDEGLAVPYQPFVEVLRSLLPTLDVEQLRSQLGALAPELGRLLPELRGWGPPAPADAESARAALFEAVVALLELTAARQPTLLVIDDLQWAAPATLLLLRHVIGSERPLALLLVVTYRSTEVRQDEPLAALLDDLQAADSVQDVPLAGLDEEAITSLLRAAAGPALADRASQLGARVHAQTAGNPFFVRELVAHLLETDALLGEAAGSTTAPGQIDIPEGLRNVVWHRAARLSEPARELLAIASVTTGAVEVSLLQALHPQADVLSAVDEGIAAGLLVEREPGALAFAHALVRHAVCDSLSTERRLHLHRLLAAALEARGDARAHVEALAYHFAQLALDGELDKAASYAIAAGEAATARLAYEDAAMHYERGLDVLAQAREAHGPCHAEMLLGLGRARWSTGESDKARAAFTQAAELAHASDDATAAADAALGFSGPFFEVGAAWSRSGEVLLQRALGMLNGHDSAVRARLMGRLALAHIFTGPQHDHRALARDALTIARGAHDAHALADVLAICYFVTRRPDHPEHNLRMARELTRLAVELGDVRLLAYGHGAVIGHCLELGDIDGALQEVDELERLAQTRNDRYVRWLLAANRALLACVAGQLQPAESFSVEAIGQWADRPQFAPPAQLFGGQMFLLRREQGRLDELIDAVAVHVEQGPEVPAWRCALAHTYAQLGDRDPAAHELELVGDPARLPHDALWLLSVTLVGTTASYLDDHDRCRQAYELLLPHANVCLVNPSMLCEGSTSRPLGMLATTLGRYDDAERHFTRALEMNARIRSPLWTSHTQYEYARMLRRRSAAGDREQARALLATACATASELGLLALSRRAAAEARLVATG